MPSKRESMVGKRYGRLRVIGTAKYPKVLCLCDCGVEKLINAYNILRGAVVSCTCKQADNLQGRNKTHGASKTRTYKAWCAMWTRCTNPKVDCYGSYKHRKPPEVWRSFESFLHDVGECPPGFTLERVDNTKPYGPGNCKWIPAHEQPINRSTTTIVRLEGEIMSLKKAALKAGRVYTTVIHKVRKQGLSVSDALGVSVEVLKHPEGK